MKLFFSYGHDCNAEIVARLKADLEADGHQVWLDTEKIREGDDWRRRLIEGLADTALVVGMLSKHATRETSVCLDELSIALHHKAGAIITILLEAEREVRPPVTVSHVQWLDMQDWQERRAADAAAFETWYAERLATLKRLLADPATERFAGEIEALREALQPVEQAARIGELIEGFVGREWLVAKLEDWRRNHPESKLLWLAGQPGMGKSAFAAWVAHYGRGNVVALNLCAWNNRDTANPDRVIRTLAFQMATRIPSFRLRLLERLRNDTRLLDGTPGELFDRLLIRPLNVLIDGGQRQDPFLIVLDALDETMQDGRCELAEVLAEQAPRLPPWINLLVTSRPETPIMQQLGALHPLMIEPDAAENRADLEVYARGWLGRAGRPAEETEALVRRVAEAAEGNMLYLRKLREAVDGGQIALDDPRGLPRGLSGIYGRWFQRQFPDAAAYRAEIARLLAVLAVASRPVPQEVLRAMFGWSVPAMAAVRESLGGLVDAQGGAWQPFHKSLRDWLLDPEAAGARFVVDAEEGRALLADAVWARFLALAAGGTFETTEVFFLHEFPRHVEADEARVRARLGAAIGWEAASAAASGIARQLRDARLAELAVAWWDTASQLALAGAPEPEALIRAHDATDEAGRLLLRVIGRTGSASERFHKIMLISMRLASSDLSNVAWQRYLSISHERLGDVLMTQGDRQGALREYHAQMESAVRLAESEPGNVAWQLGLSVSHDRLGDVLMAQGDRRGALRAYQAAMEICAHVAASDPGNAEWQRSLSISHDKLGDVLIAQGDQQGALGAYRAGREIRARLVASDPGNATWQRDLSVSHDRVGNVLMAQGNRQGALCDYKISHTIVSSLASSDPSNAEWQSDLSISHSKLGDVLMAQGDRQGALREYHAAMEIRARLASSDPSNAEWQRDLSISHSKLGDVLGAQGQRAGALREFQSSHDIVSRLASSDPGNAAWRRDLAICHDRLGDVLLTQGDWVGALREFRGGMMLRASLAASDPGSLALQHDLSISHERLGSVLAAQDDLAGALREYQACMEIRARLVAWDPGNAEWQRALSISHERLGDALRANDDLVAALCEYGACMEIRTRLVALDPGNLIWQHGLSVSHERLGNVLLARDDLVGALREYRTGMAITVRLASSDPNNAEWQRDLFAAYWQVARIAERAGDIEKLEQCALAARTHARWMVAAFPQMPEFRELCHKVETASRQLGLPDDDPPSPRGAPP